MGSGGRGGEIELEAYILTLNLLSSLMVKTKTDFFSVMACDRFVNHFRNHISVLPFNQITDDYPDSITNNVGPTLYTVG